jgi:hypothetical protein
LDQVGQLPLTVALLQPPEAEQTQHLDLYLQLLVVVVPVLIVE